MHHIHRTKAYVLKNLPMRDYDSRLILLTQDFGLIRVIAVGTKRQNSKLKSSIQEYSEIDVALVLGKSGWRLVNANFIKNFFYEIEDMETKKSICRVLGIIERFFLGESNEHNEIFEIVKNYINFSYNNIILSVNFEIIFIAKILESFGYLDLQKFNLPSDVLVPDISPLVSEKIQLEINRSIYDSGL